MIYGRNIVNVSGYISKLLSVALHPGYNILQEISKLLSVIFHPGYKNVQVKYVQLHFQVSAYE